MTSIVLRTSKLTRRFGRRVAVDGLDLEVHAGDVFGFLGPNGAGKSTTLRMIVGLIRPTSGVVELMGKSSRRTGSSSLAEVGAIIEEPAFYPYLSGERNVRMLASLSGGAKPEELDWALDLVGLKGREREPVARYSHGMKQRLGLAAALLPHPRLILLDEPTTGLDPQGIHEIRNLLPRLADEGITVVLSSHLLHEVELTCNRVAILNHGKLIAQGNVADLLASDSRVYALETDDAEQTERLFALHSWAEVLPRRNGRVRVKAALGQGADLSQAVMQAGLRLHALIPEEQSLEDFFFSLTGSRGGR
ncbi:MAG: ABC transporter ATP-binding protein [Armatimonadetes bacterium]|nr:ABC transporter ATP-binding protein [Armatimonadota bacterium]